MKVITALLVCLAIKGTFAKKCQNPVTCTCGISGKNVTVCATAYAHAEVCNRLSKCEECRDGFRFCTKCPEGLKGPTCSREIRYRPTRYSVSIQTTETKISRTFSYLDSWNYRFIHTTTAAKSRDCHDALRPKFGISKCGVVGNEKCCKGTCFDGYYFEGTEKEKEMNLTCRGGFWTPWTSFPACIPTGECEFYQSEAGRSNCTADPFHKYCDVWCDRKYRGRFKCCPGHPWEPRLPPCLTPNIIFKEHETYCRHPGWIPNARMEYFAPGNSDPESYEIRWFPGGSVVEYTCEEGFRIQEGSGRLRCETTGNWSEVLPTCVPATTVDKSKDCLDVPRSKYGISTCSTIGNKKSCNGTCFVGYYFDGTEKEIELTLTCRDGVWTPRTSFPDCIATGECDFYQSEAGRSNCTSDPFHKYCDVWCDHKYRGQFKCYPGHPWEPRLPPCLTPNIIFKEHETYCRHPGRIPDASMQYFAPGNSDPESYEIEWFPGGSEVQYTCEEGFQIQEGSGRLRCETTGNWSKALPTCIPATVFAADEDCPYPRDSSRPRAGIHECLTAGNVKSCKFTCFDGYYFEGTEKEKEMTLTCKGGVWTPWISFPACIPTGECEYYRSEAGQSNCTADNFATTCDVWCDHKYRGQFKCYPGHPWEPRLPPCLTPNTAFEEHGVYCRHPGRIPNASISYFVSGNSSPESYEIEYFPGGSEVEFTCEEGFRIQEGSRRLRCETSGNWSEVLPTCTPVTPAPDSKDCPEALLPRTFGIFECYTVENKKYCKGKCFDGHYFEGTDKEKEMTLTCNDGVWSPRTSFPDCIATGECDFYQPEAGRSNCTAYPSHKNCDVWCDHKYRGQFKCYPGLPWEPRLPPCLTPNAAFKEHGVYCRHPGRIPDARIQYFAPGKSDPESYEIERFPGDSVVEYTCEEGFRIQEGSGRLRCEKSGNWSEVLPTCVQAASSMDCPDLPPPKYATARCYTEGNKKFCKGTCFAGFFFFVGIDREKEITLTCNDGVWIHWPSFPKCSSTEECDTIQDETGRSNCTSYPTHKTCDVWCDHKYRGQFKCYPGRPWEPRLPPCIRPKAFLKEHGGYCIHPGRIPNARLQYFAPGNSDPESYEIYYFPAGSIVEYTCEEGFRIQEGSGRLRCEKSEIWSEVLPTCIPATTIAESKECLDPSPLNFGISKCDARGNEKSCKFTCFAGFYLSGTEREKEMTLTCREGVWSPRTSFPDCIPSHECGLNRFEEGHYNCSFDFVHAYCDIWCGHKYRGQFKCYPGRPWEPRLPPCITPNLNLKQSGVYCYHPGRTPNARMQYFAPGNSDPELYEIRWFPAGSEVEYTCEEGFRIQEGSGRLRCEANGTWSELTPLCVPGADDCDLFNQTLVEANCTVDPNGTHCDVWCGNEHMGRFFCYPGHGWEPTVPLCVTMRAAFDNASYCDNPAPLSFGEVQYFAPGRRDRLDSEIEKFPEGSLVEYTCDEGYVLHGYRRLTCMSTGNWTALRPNCVEVPAAAESKKCPDAALPQFSTSKCDTVLGDGRSCNVTCYNLYYFQGTDNQKEMTLTCRDGVWTPLTSCIITPECAYHRQDSGQVDCSVNHFRTKCDVWCDHKYRGQFKCYPGRSWEPRLPPCLIPNVAFKQHGASCTHPGRIPNAKTQYFASDESNDPESYEMEYFPDGSVVEYTCGEGLQIVEGSHRLICQKSGFWSDVLPTCVPVPMKTTCRDPGFIANGVRRNADGSESTVNDTYEEGQSVVYSCTSNEFALQGSSSLTCGQDGQWSRPLPVCIERTTRSFCRDPGVDENGSRESQSPSSPLGFAAGSLLEYSCNEGYSLDGEWNIICLASGEWTAGRPRCVSNTNTDVVYCENLGIISNGQVVYYPISGNRRELLPQDDEEFPEWSRLEYSCDDGYTLFGQKNLICEKSGLWSDDPPYCRIDTSRRTYCLHPGDLADGRVEHIPVTSEQEGRRPSIRDPQQYPEGSRLRYSCDEGYALDGPPILTCRRSGSWSPAVPPKCANVPEKTTCRDPGFIENGIRRNANGSESSVNQTYERGQSVFYDCISKEFALEGYSSLTCKHDGQWSRPLPVCIRQRTSPESVLFCQPPGLDAGSSVQVQWPLTVPKGVYPVGSRLKYSCNQGYRLIGENVIICLKSGEWTASRPRCVPNINTREYCLYPGDVVNGLVEYIAVQNQQPRPTSTGDREEYPEGSRLRYSCDEGYIPVGPAILTCQSSGSWSPAVPPTCINADDNDRVNCQNLGRVLNGRVWYFAPGVRNDAGVKLDTEMEEYPGGSMLEYHCDSGFWLQGSQSLVCDSTGYWSGRRPTCVADCGRSSSQLNGRTRNDQETESGVQPWVVSISLQGENGTDFVCGGAVFNSRAVVTAAHCLKMDRTYILRFGKHQFKIEDDDTQVLNRTSSQVIIHPDYSRNTLDSDIAVIVFDPPIEYSTSVQPICMPTIETTITNIKPGTVGYVSGWGPTESDLKSDSQLFVRLPVLRKRSCAESYMRQNLTVTMTGNMFCAGHFNETFSVCKGDGGSPLVFYDKISQRYTLEGLVSFVFRNRTDAQECGLPGRFAIFTKVFRFVPWMYENVQ